MAKAKPMADVLRGQDAAELQKLAGKFEKAAKAAEAVADITYSSDPETKGPAAQRWSDLSSHLEEAALLLREIVNPYVAQGKIDDVFSASDQSEPPTTENPSGARENSPDVLPTSDILSPRRGPWGGR